MPPGICRLVEPENDLMGVFELVILECVYCRTKGRETSEVRRAATDRHRVNILLYAYLWICCIASLCNNVSIVVSKTQ